MSITIGIVVNRIPGIGPAPPKATLILYYIIMICPQSNRFSSSGSRPKTVVYIIMFSLQTLDTASSAVSIAINKYDLCSATAKTVFITTNRGLRDNSIPAINYIFFSRDQARAYDLNV